MNIYALIWVLVSAAGLALTIYFAAQLLLDLSALRQMQVVNGRRASVKLDLSKEALRASAHVGFLFIGIAALQVQAGPFSWVTVILIWGNVVYLLTSTIDAHKRGVLSTSQAQHVVETAAVEARELVQRAAVTAAALKESNAAGRVAVAAEVTAANTAQIVENTARE